MERLLAGIAVAVLTLTAACSASEDDPRDPARAASTTTDADVPPPQTSVSKQAETGRPDPVDVPDDVASAASDTVTDFADAVAEALTHPDAKLADGGPVRGAALDALQAQADEYARSGWRVQGRPRVVSVEVYERTDDRMVVGACVDDSRVMVVDQSGRVVSDNAGRPPTLNILTLSVEDSGWVVVDSTFAGDPEC